MKKYISYTMIAFLATFAISTAATNDDALQEKEKAAWQAFKDKKADDFKKLVAANVVAVYAEGMSDMQKELADMQKWDMKSFAISDYKVVSDGPNIAVSTYTVKIEGTYDGKDQSGTYNAGSVWHKRARGEWQAIFHTNVKQAPAGG
jgi:ketosteroid isomerase-like protein